jgi:hypothetical protein
MPRDEYDISIEDQVKLNYVNPAPNTYAPREPARFTQVPGGKVSDAQIPSYLDVAAQRSTAPGPGAYEVVDDGMALPEGGQWGEIGERPFRLPDGTPSPDAYDPKLVPRTVKLAKFTTMSKKEIPAYLQEAERLGHSLPGPGQYDDMEAFGNINPFLPTGGKTLQASKNTSYFDDVAKAHAHSTGPKYDIRKDFVVEPQGQPVYRYQSSTWEQTKALVEDACATHVPGPGAYEAVQPPPPPGAPDFKRCGRDYPAALPPPFDYNCAKDVARRYVPLRKSGAHDQIYGRFKSRSAPRLTPLSTSVSDRSEEHSEPLSPPARTDDSQRLKKKYLKESDRADEYRKGLHPMVKEAAGTYKVMSGQKHAPTTMLLPMAARRYVEVGTDEDQPEFKAYERHRAKLDLVASSIDSLTQSLCSPLDVKAMRAKAQAVLEEKVKARLKVEGVRREKRKLVLQELPRALEEKFEQSDKVLSIASPFAGGTGTPQREAAHASLTDTFACSPTCGTTLTAAATSDRAASPSLPDGSPQVGLSALPEDPHASLSILPEVSAIEATQLGQSAIEATQLEPDTHVDLPQGLGLSPSEQELVKKEPEHPPPEPVTFLGSTAPSPSRPLAEPSGAQQSALSSIAGGSQPSPLEGQLTFNELVPHTFDQAHTVAGDDEAAQAEAVVKIQAVHRGKQGRARAEEIRLQSHADRTAGATAAPTEVASEVPGAEASACADDEAAQAKAVVKIQAVHRGKQGRARAEEMRAKGSEVPSGMDANATPGVDSGLQGDDPVNSDT